MVEILLVAQFVISFLLVVSAIPRVIETSCKVEDALYLLNLALNESNIAACLYIPHVVFSQVWTLVVVIILALGYVAPRVFNPNRQIIDVVHFVGLLALAAMLLLNVFWIEQLWLSWKI